ncbi:triacylglycerol hydrolase DDHD2-like [Ptychodera flava]|uniref:triacylglycerol hydrolase DDHD2-like n=1 Tax=Ptychodera flava TaxID=63121 RepID=UPI00396A3A7C
MADQKDQSQASPPLLLFPPSEGLAPQLVPVPATASLFPAEDGEADSFLGQNDPLPSVEQQSPYSFFQQQQMPSQPDPFANLSQHQQQPPLQPPLPVSEPLSPPTSQSYYVQQQQVVPPSVNQPPPPTYEQAKYAAKPPQRPQMPYSHQTSPPPPGGAPPPTTGFVPRSQFDPSKPPPTAAEMEQMRSSAQSVPNPQALYNPVQAHWFYCKEIEHRSVWKPFSMTDSLKLEESLTTVQQDPQENIVQTDGGRYDVNVSARVRNAVYWEEKPTEVRRCTWFYKGDGDNKFTPYLEKFALKLEEEYQVAVTNNLWHRRLEFPDGEAVVMHNPNVIVHFRPTSHPDEWGTVADSNVRPRVVKRGMDEDISEVEEGEPNQIDHVLFVVHGIGPVCDLRFRSIVECVDDFRSVSLALLQSHFRNHQEEGRIGRIEFIPVSWHDVLHGDATGVDRQLRKITLPSIGRLRHFTNDTLLDILFYSSPTYCQTVCDRVAGEINRLYALFMQRNPSFSGKASLIGHSLGSLVCFDLLSHQKDPNAVEQPPEEEPLPAPSPPQQQPESRTTAELELDSSFNVSSAAAELVTLPSLEETLAQLGLSGFLETFLKEQVDMESLIMCGESDLKEMGLPLGPRKKLTGFVKELAQRQEEKKKEVAERAKLEAELRAKRKEEERQQQEQQQQLQVQQQVQRQETDSNLHGSAISVHVDYTPGVTGIGQPFVNYPQFDFKPACFFGLGSPVALFLTVRGVDSVGLDFKLPTCDGYYNIFHPFDPVAYRVEPIINPEAIHIKPVLMPHHKGRKRLHLELRDSLTSFGADLKRSLVDSMKKTWKTIHQFALSHTSGEGAEPTDEEMEKIAEQLTRDDSKSSQLETASIASSDDFEMIGDELKLGALNKGNRIDFVLQEKPIESFNEYLFALGSHACYWESEDTVLMILKEVYALQGILPQKQGPDRRHQPPPPPQQRTLLPSP